MSHNSTQISTQEEEGYGYQRGARADPSGIQAGSSGPTARNPHFQKESLGKVVSDNGPGPMGAAL